MNKYNENIPYIYFIEMLTIKFNIYIHGIFPNMFALEFCDVHFPVNI